jgi:glutamine synthetase
LPVSLAEAQEAFRQDAMLRTALGEPFCQAWDALADSRGDD